MSAKPVEKKPETPAKGQKKRPTKQTNANDDQQPQPAQESSDWKSVPTKKPRKLVLSSSRIARVIGRSGCNVNAIRDVTGTHIGKNQFSFLVLKLFSDIEKPKKGGGERTITIRGNCESTTMAYKLMEELINSDKDITELIEQHFPDKKSTSSAGSVKGDSKEDAKEEKAEKPKTTSSIEAALAAVQQSEKILSEKNERKKKKEEEEARKKKELEAKAKEEARKAALISPKQPVTPVHKVTPVIPVVQEKPLGKAKDMDRETDRKVSEYLRGLALQDEKKRQEKTQEKPAAVVVEQLPSSPQPTTPIFIGTINSDPIIPASAPPPPPVAPIAPPTVPITPIAKPGPIGPPSRPLPTHQDYDKIFTSVIDPVLPPVSMATGGPPGLSQRPVSPPVHEAVVSPIGSRTILPPSQQSELPMSTPKIAPIGPPREPKPPKIAVIPPIQNPTRPNPMSSYPSNMVSCCFVSALLISSRS